MVVMMDNNTSHGRCDVYNNSKMTTAVNPVTLMDHYVPHDLADIAFRCMSCCHDIQIQSDMTFEDFELHLEYTDALT